MADILESGVDVNELKPIRTQNELLNRYWSYRVGGSGGDSRERILRKTCDLMIQARRLRTERHGLVEPGSEAALRELFSNQVLVEWQPPGASVPQRQLVAFSHHILFDFAVAQLFVPPEPAQMTRLIAEDPDLILMIRPSLVMHFQQLWESDRSSFWKLLFRICEDTQIPQIGKVIGAVVAAEAGRTVQDFEPLQRALGANTEVTRVAAERAFRYLVGALSVGPTTALVGPTAGPYCELLSILTKAPNESVAGYALTLLRTALGNGDLSSFTPQQFLMAGSAARNVLTFAWAQEKRNSFLVTNALRSVCMTFQSDTPASAALLRRAIEPEHLAKYGYEETHWIAREIKKIVDFDPELVSDIYAAIFGHDEPSTESTNMSHSRILSLTSNRRQDYDHTKWQLAEDYPQFVQRAPLAATRAVTRLIDAYVANRHRHSSGSPAIEVFNINGKQAAMVTDHSHIWDESASAHSDNEIKILDTFFRQLEDLVQLHEKGEVVDRILDILLSGNRQAVIWARLLRLGARYPAEFGSRMHSLAWTVPLLVAIDTEHDAGDFVEALFPLLSAEERELVENAIVSLPNAVDAKMKQFVERYRARLLGRLNPADLVTLQARHLLQELEAADKIPEPTPRPKIQVFSREIDERMVVEDMLGVSADKESHKNFLNVHRPVKTFYTQYSNTTPTVGEAETILPSLLALHEAIGNQSGDVDSKLLVMASGTMAGACKVIAHIDKLDCESPVGRFAQSTLLELSHHPDPEHDPDHDAAFDKSPSWSAPIARTEAAAGLISIARHGSCHGSEVLDAIQRLGRDPAPEVRYQIAAHLLSLYETAREQMWTFLKERTQSETSTAVLDALASCLGGLAGKFPDRSVELSKRIFDRTVMGSGSAEPQNRCIHTFVGLYVWQNHPASKDIVYSLVTDVQAHTRELSLVLSVLRGPLTEGATVQKTDNNSAVRARAVELFHSVTVVACNSFTDLLARSQTQAWSESDGETLREVARLVGHAATELYFASGVFRAGQNAEKEVTREEQERFYTELTPTIDRLSTIGLASMVHRLVEMLEVFVPLDPRKVFLHLSALVDSGKRDNYQYESLAIDHIVRAVERYLAEYRTLLQEDAECRTALRQILDVFVEAGWPAAQQLSYRLDDIFR